MMVPLKSSVAVSEELSSVLLSVSVLSELLLSADVSPALSPHPVSAAPIVIAAVNKIASVLLFIIFDLLSLVCFSFLQYRSYHPCVKSSCTVILNSDKITTFFKPPDGVYFIYRKNPKKGG